MGHSRKRRGRGHRDRQLGLCSRVKRLTDDTPKDDMFVKWSFHYNGIADARERNSSWPDLLPRFVSRSGPVKGSKTSWKIDH